MVRRRVGKAIVKIMLGIILGIVIFMVTTTVFVMLVTGAFYKEPSKKGVARIENAIGISLPEDAEVVYHYYDSSPDSSYTQFTVLKLQANPDDFLSNYPLMQVDESWGYDYFVRSVKGQNIKEKHIPSFDELLMSKKTNLGVDELTVVYFPSTLQLAFFIIHVG